MRPGQGLSGLSEQGAAGSGRLPLERAVSAGERAPPELGAQQGVDYGRRQGWQPAAVLAVAAADPTAPTLRPLVGAGGQVLGRVSAKRVCYLPLPPYRGTGRPRVRGRQLQLSAARPLPEPTPPQRVAVAAGGWSEIGQGQDGRRHQWPTQPLVR